MTRVLTAQASYTIFSAGFFNDIFVFFLFGFVGWIAETINETVTRKKFVNKGFFRGPFVLSQAIGGMLVWAIGAPLRSQPALVFLCGMVSCTIVEYALAIFLEKCFAVKCWDYRTYPHTKWCNFQGRIALTISLFFGLITLVVVYFLADFCVFLARMLGVLLFLADGFFLGAFCFDAITRCADVIAAKKNGRRIEGIALFSADTNITSGADGNANSSANGSAISSKSAGDNS